MTCSFICQASARSPLVLLSSRAVLAPTVKADNGPNAQSAVLAPDTSPAPPIRDTRDLRWAAARRVLSHGLPWPRRLPAQQPVRLNSPSHQRPARAKQDREQQEALATLPPPWHDCDFTGERAVWKGKFCIV